MIVLMKRIAHAISGISEKPALLTEGGLLLALSRLQSTASKERGGVGKAEANRTFVVNSNPRAT